MKFIDHQILYFSVRAIVRSLHAIAYALQENGKGAKECMEVSLRHLEFVDDCVQAVGERTCSPDDVSELDGCVPRRDDGTGIFTDYGGPEK